MGSTLNDPSVPCEVQGARLIQIHGPLVCTSIWHGENEEPVIHVRGWLGWNFEIPANAHGVYLGKYVFRTKKCNFDESPTAIRIHILNGSCVAWI